MTKDEMAEIFAEYEYGLTFAFETVKNKLSNRADLHAFLLLDNIDSGQTSTGHFMNIIAAAEHDEIWLSFDEDKVAEAITREQVIELRRCGVMYNNDGLGFHMFA